MGGEILENLWLFPFTINLPRTGGVNKIFQASLVDFGHLGGRKFMIVPFTINSPRAGDVNKIF